MQVTALPILLNISMPIHLYESLRLMSSFVYAYIPAWNENPPYVQPRLPFGVAVDELRTNIY